MSLIDHKRQFDHLSSPLTEEDEAITNRFFGMFYQEYLSDKAHRLTDARTTYVRQVMLSTHPEIKPLLLKVMTCPEVVKEEREVVT